MPPTVSDSIWVVEVIWADGARTVRVVEQGNLEGLTWEQWIEQYLVKAQRPHWARLGDLVFYTQNVRSIDLIETIEKED